MAMAFIEDSQIEANQINTFYLPFITGAFRHKTHLENGWE